MKNDKELQLTIEPYPKQVRFFECTRKYIAYGGARGGGKSWAARTKAVLLALNYSGIKILLLRRTLPELRENHVLPLQTMLNGVANYSPTNKDFTFPNGSRIILGYCKAESDVLQYQGQSYDVIFLEEATQFSEFQFTTLTESNRSSGLVEEGFSPRMYFTCNPGGVGHAWVKRLFIDRDYRDREDPENYDFIPSLVYDNQFIVENDPGYIKTLESLPEMRRRAMLEGDWDAFEGQYFAEFRRDLHVVKPYEIPQNYNKFISIDYGLDMTAAYWWAVDMDGFCVLYRELHEQGLILSKAAEKIKQYSLDEKYQYIVASPDLWNKRQETGQSGAEIMAGAGLDLMRPANNSRVQGWRLMREYFRPTVNRFGIEMPRLRIFETCNNAIKNIPQLQHHATRLEDAADTPHEVTHACESIRYGLMSRPPLTAEPIEQKIFNFEFEKPKPSPTGFGDQVIDI